MAPTDKIVAAFSKGVLTVTMPKSARAQPAAAPVITDCHNSPRNDTKDPSH